jgi:hypothetical protein
MLTNIDRGAKLANWPKRQAGEVLPLPAANSIDFTGFCHF